MLAKANMAEWAFSPDVSIGSAFGVVRNPYDTDRSTAGSSGGTAAGIARLLCFSTAMHGCRMTHLISLALAGTDVILLLPLQWQASSLATLHAHSYVVGSAADQTRPDA